MLEHGNIIFIQPKPISSYAISLVNKQSQSGVVIIFMCLKWVLSNREGHLQWSIHRGKEASIICEIDIGVQLIANPDFIHGIFKHQGNRQHKIRVISR